MEKFNAIKILEEELEGKKIFDKNISKEHYMKSVYAYVDNYVEPLLKKRLNELDLKAPKELIEYLTQDISSDESISDENKKNMLKTDVMDLYFQDTILKQLVASATQVVNELGFINEEDYIEEEFEEDDIRSFLDKDEVCFLSKDKKTKEKVANKICDLLIEMAQDNQYEE